jgi:lactoylglutathione lyase
MKVDLITIEVKSLDESLEFYTNVLGLKEIKRISPEPFINIVFLEDEQSNIVELIKNDKSNEGTIENEKCKVSLVFKVDNLEAILVLLESKNIKTASGPMPGYIFTYDPNGVRIGLKEDAFI